MNPLCRRRAGSPVSELRKHWGSAYVIVYVPDARKPYQARRRDGRAGRFSSAREQDMWDQIRADYGRTPVPRAVAP